LLVLPLVLASACTPAAAPPAPTTESPTAIPSSEPPTGTPTSDPAVAPLIKPLVSSWRPSDTTVIAIQVARKVGAPDAHTLVAVPATAGPATPLIANLPDPGTWDIRRDGSALVVAVNIALAPSRLATWDLRTGAQRWITPEDGVAAMSPRWSSDGAFVYFGRVGGSARAADLGLFSVRADGSDLRRILDLPAGKVGFPEFVSDQGVLFWRRVNVGTEGATLEALDLASGRPRSVGPCLDVRSWRPTQPRALLQTAVCAVGPQLLGLMLWNDVSGTLTPLTDPSTELSLGADWDPTGTQIVASLRGRSGTEPPALVTMAASGAARTRLQGTENARDPLWLRAGIAYISSLVTRACAECLDFGPPYEIRLIAPDGGAPKTLYRSEDEIVGIRFVRP